MNKIINGFLLTGDKFMPKMCLGQPRFTYSACRPFTKYKERMKKFYETVFPRCVYQNKLDKAFFQHDISYEYLKDLTRRITSDKVLHDKVFDVVASSKI